MFFTLSILGIGLFLSLLAIRRHYAVRRLKAASVNPADSRLWQDIAAGLFASYGEELSKEERIELALRSGLRRLGSGGGIVTINTADCSRVISVITSDDAAPVWLKAGKEVSLALTYCGLLNESRENLAIDFASLSDWRHHSAHRDLGWETFIGTRRSLESGDYLSVGFFGWTAREQIFGAEEKLFLAQLANWISAISQSQPSAVGEENFLPELAAGMPAALNHEIIVQ